MERHDIAMGGGRARVWLGGDGAALLLLHGAWGGAALHWAPVWNALASSFRIIAPELPGVGDDDTPGLPSIDHYASWVEELVTALGVERVLCVGNSFGATIAWQLSARLGARCAGVVLVNGPPPGPTPGWLKSLAQGGVGRKVCRALYRRLSFSPAVVSRAFADTSRAPAELIRTLASPRAAMIETLLDIIAAGATTAPRPHCPILLTWGASDRLPGTGIAKAEALHRELSGSQLVAIPNAGHLPQCEQPSLFVDAIRAFAR